MQGNAFTRLVRQIEKTFKYSKKDSILYAEYLVKKQMQEYKNAYSEMIITK